MDVFITQDQLGDMEEPQIKFIFDQAEKQLKEILTVGDTVVTRTTTLLTLSSGLLVGLIGYAINRWDGQKIDALFWSSALSMAYLLVPMFLLISLIIPAQYSVTGSSPKHFFTDAFFNADIKKDKRILHLYASEIINYQVRIDKNLAQTQKRWKRYKKAILFIAGSPVAFATLYLLVLFLSHPSQCGHCL